MESLALSLKPRDPTRIDMTKMKDRERPGNYAKSTQMKVKTII